MYRSSINSQIKVPFFSHTTVGTNADCGGMGKNQEACDVTLVCASVRFEPAVYAHASLQ